MAIVQESNTTSTEFLNKDAPEVEVCFDEYAKMLMKLEETRKTILSLITNVKTLQKKQKE